MKKELPEKLQIALKTIIDEFENEDQFARERQIQLWKKLDFYWSGITKIWWSEIAHDWRVYDDNNDDENNNDKEINVYRAYLESIIAALSSSVPVIKCKPDDADNVNDVLTAKGGTKIAELVYDHIDAPLLWCKALWIYCSQGMIACYNYTEEDEKYGTVPVAKYESVEEDVQTTTCPQCGEELAPQQMMDDLNAEIGDEFDPSINSDDVLGNNIPRDPSFCETCQQVVQPEVQVNKLIVERMVGQKDQPKARQCLKIEGGLYVKIPNYAREQKDIPYLSYDYETHYSNIYAKYPDLRDKFDDTTSSDSNQDYERWGRLNTQYAGDFPRKTPTVRNWWLRFSSFEMVKEKEERNELKKKFPHGCKIVLVNDEFAEVVDEALDDHWTLTFNPLANFLHFDPLGLLLTSVQEISNELIELELQTIQHGIPQTFADPSILNFPAYREMRTVPGAIYPARAKSGKQLSEGFYTISTATLSQEVEPFGNKIQEMAQFVSGALPSLFGGSAPGMGKTAAQYSMSRNQALQRLQTPWKMINFWWKNIFAKVIPAYIKGMLDDERLVKEVHGSFINVMIRKSEMDGKIGSVTIASADEIPHSWGQVKDTVMQLIQTNNPQILEAIGAPNNLQVLSDAIGLNDFLIPGEDDREKQLEEIQLLLRSEPIMGPLDPMTGQPEEMPSIMPEMDVDNHKIEADIVREWAVSEAGRQAKIDNPAGYKNNLLHLKIHIQMLQQLSAPPMPQGPAPDGKKQLRPVGGKK